MSNERPDDASQWINKLGDPDPSAAEPWEGKNAAWETLYSRLHEKPRRKIPAWYWAAAACLLLILYIPVKRAIRGSQTRGQGEQILAKEPGAAKEMEAENLPGTKGEPGGKGERTLTIRTPVAIGRKQVSAGRKPMVKEEIRPASTASASVVVTANNLPAADTLTIAALIVPPAKKKLRVVHINELSESGEQNNLAMNPESHPPTQGIVAWANTPVIQRPIRNNQIFTGNPRKHFLHFGRPKEQAEPWSTASTDNIRSELIKIKISPQN
jgi:hypothetical protein